MQDMPLGRATEHPDTYSADLLFPMARAGARAALGVGSALPFRGADVWNAWDLTWLGDAGRPEIADLEFRVPADSPRIVESKSLKLYLNSYSMSRFASADAVLATLRADLSAAAGADVAVALRRPGDLPLPVLETLPGACIDDADVACDTWTVEPALLRAEPAVTTDESLHSHLLRSLCPVTGQPDLGSVLVSYRGPRIDPADLLRYIVSYRRHQDFHEACVERMFLDIRARCAPESLTVYARYQRRGGIDINPWRSTGPATLPNWRTWRQ
ncbi:MAG TPA: NADPH-dependent 7-cyano-7-deazaguanine reductase QueF [Woeseiaceae bacterium]|nr:NADPH-dependent 7-cyano-7-deazaguanine reductase QueF [Woeseiaceae bacterium]